jgi:signal transduction histidine kinase
MLPAALGVAALEPGPPRVLELKALVEQARDAGGHAAVRLVPGAWPRVEGDAALLVRALGALLANAVEATPAAAPPPEVSVSAGGGEVAVRVRDWGTGLRTTNPKLLIRLLHSTKRGHPGLGLVVVERAARLHGGTVEFESLPDGTRVTLRLRGAGASAG